jgi:hypothetical protein
MHRHMHNRSWFARGVARFVAIVVAASVAITVLSWAVMMLWNWLMPTLFGLGRITLWQAFGLFVLGRLLFGGFRGFRGGHRGHRHRRHMHERWQQMTPEQRESFSRGLRHGCSWRHHERDDRGANAEKPVP